MIQTAFVTREYNRDQIIELEGITSLAVLNNSRVYVIVNGRKIRPNNKETIVTGDNTWSNLIINLSFTTETVTNNPQITALPLQSVLLIYKKIV